MTDDPQASAARTARHGAAWMLLFWLALLGALYAGFDRYNAHKAAQYKAYTSTSGQLVIPRGPDGHFHVDGEINGQPVRFLVDTGASTVSVTDSLAHQAGLAGGIPATFDTANGTRQGRILRDVPMRAGPLAARVRIGVALTASRDDEALLGQSFLQQFDMQIGKTEMVLKAR